MREFNSRFYQFHEPGLRPIRVHYSQTPEISRREFGLRAPGVLDCGLLELVWSIEAYLQAVVAVDLSVDVVLGKRRPRCPNPVPVSERRHLFRFPWAVAMHMHVAPPSAGSASTVDGVARTVAVEGSSVYIEVSDVERHGISSWDKLGPYVGDTAEEWE